MRLKIVAALLYACACLWSVAAQAQSNDPADYFLNAYTAFEKGAKLESGGKPQPALQAYQEASGMLDQITAKWPTWNPSVVDFRRKRTAEAIAKVQQKVGGGGGNAPEAPLPELPPAGGTGRSVEPPLPDEPVLSGGENPPTSRPPRRGSKTPAAESTGGGRDPIAEIQKAQEQMKQKLEDSLHELEEARKQGDDYKKKLAEVKKAEAEAEQKGKTLQVRADVLEHALTEARAKGTQDSESLQVMKTQLAQAKSAVRDLAIEKESREEVDRQRASQFVSSLRRGNSAKDERDAAVKTSKDEQKHAETAIAAEKKRADDAQSLAQASIAEIQKKSDSAIATAQKRVDAALKERDDLTTKLASMTGERDAALQQVQKLKDAQKQVDKLVNDNTRLMAQLDTAQKQISQFKADGVQKDTKIAELTKEVGAVKIQLADTQKQSAAYQTQMAELQSKLKLTSDTLSQMKTANAAGVAEKKKMQDENELLRGIVLRQMKDDARRAGTRKLVLDQVRKMDIKSTELLNEISYLGQPIVKLTDKERALFKKPQVEMSSDNDITMVAPRAATPAELGASLLPAAPPPPPLSQAPLLVEDVEKPLTPEPPRVAPATAPMVAPTAVTPPSASVPVKAAPAPPQVSPPPPVVAQATPAEKPLKLAENTPKATPAPPAATPAREPMKVASIDTHKPAASPALSLDLPVASAIAPLPGPDTSSRGASSPALELPGASHESAGMVAGGDSSKAPAGLPKEMLPLVQEAKDEFDRGNYREAEKSYERILTKEPTNLYALSNLGVVRYRSGKLKLAEESFHKAIAIAPEDGFSHCTLGIVFYVQNKYDEAVNELTKALAINPKNATAHNYLGITASQKGWQDAAQKELETATSIDPNYGDAWFNLAVVYATRQPPDKENARRAYKKAVELGAEADSALEQLIK